jgi:EcsC protein family
MRWRLPLHPRTPERIALAASERFAAPAARWAAKMLPHHSPARAARIARRKHVRKARLEGLVLGAGGALTAAPDLAAVLWIQGRMVFFIAASYGFDPHDPLRPAELLHLWGLYESAQDARDALDGIGTHLAVRYVQTRRDPDRHIASILIRLGARYAARRASKRVLPLLSSPVASIQNGHATAELGKQAIEYYEAAQARP